MKKIFAVILVLLMSSTWTSLSAQSRKVQIKRTEIENEKDVDINLYVVGEGECSGQYREIADGYSLTDRHVFFCGILDGEPEAV